tara:strand:+ start:324 stop:611 length:288 start_codon:yes stop_codon:yes gene_type:complete
MSDYYLDSWKNKVLIVAGKCPVELNGSSLEEVEEWICALEKKKKLGTEYKPTVYRYWARRFFNDDKEKLEEINNNIKIVTGKSTTIFDYMNGHRD